MEDKVVQDEYRHYCVYIHTNIINNKKYIGMTGQRPESRWGNNGYKYKESPYFYNAIQKYGWDNFKHEIIMDNLTRQEACDLEKELIKKLNTMDEANGYNLKEGGDCAKLSDRAKKKLSESRKGIVFSNEHLKNLTEALRNRDYSPSAKIRKEISDRFSISVSQYSKDGAFIKTWTSMIDAENELGICYQHISQCCRCVVKSAGGFIWRYANEPLTKEYVAWCNEKEYPRKRKVVQCDKNGKCIKIWEYISMAANELNIIEQHISACCRGKRKTAGGFIWKYVDEN